MSGLPQSLDYFPLDSRPGLLAAGVTFLRGNDCHSHVFESHSKERHSSKSKPELRSCPGLGIKSPKLTHHRAQRRRELVLRSQVIKL